MRAEVKTTYDGEPRIIPVTDGNGLYIETEITDPPSSKGKSVDVYVPPWLIDKLLIEFRSSAIAARKNHEGTS